MATPGSGLTVSAQGRSGVEWLLSVGLLLAPLHVGSQHQLRPVPLGPGGGEGATRGAAGVVDRHGGGGRAGLVSQGLLGGEVRLVDKQKVWNVSRSLGPLPLGISLQCVRDGSSDLLSGEQLVTPV